jgi:hypothetical protein
LTYGLYPQLTSRIPGEVDDSSGLDSSDGGYSQATHPLLTFDLTLPGTPPASYPGGAANFSVALTSIITASAALPDATYVTVAGSQVARASAVQVSVAAASAVSALWALLLSVLG